MPQVGRFGNAVDGLLTLGEPILAVMSGGAVAVGVGDADYGEPLLLLGNVITAPTSLGFAGGYLFVQNGQLVYQGQLGTRTIIAGTGRGIVAPQDFLALSDRTIRILEHRFQDPVEDDQATGLFFDDFATLTLIAPEFAATDRLLLADAVDILVGTVTVVTATDVLGLPDAAVKQRAMQVVDQSLGLFDFDVEDRASGGEGFMLGDQIGTEQIARFPNDHVVFLDTVVAQRGREALATEGLFLADQVKATVTQRAPTEDGIVFTDSVQFIAPTIDLAATDTIFMFDILQRTIERPRSEGLFLDDAAVLTRLVHPVNFDGTNDWLSRGAVLTGSADDKRFTGSLWFRQATTTSGVERRFIHGIAANGRWMAQLEATNKVEIWARNAAGVVVLDLTTSAITDTNWHHVMWSVDLANTANRHLYLDGVSDLTALTYTADGIIDFTVTDVGVGAQANGSLKFAGDLADMLVWFGTYVDLSQQSTREKFIINGRPAPQGYGADGSLPLGVAPIVFLNNPLASWHTNKGTGGGFTVNGALTAGTGPVQL